jgi:ABC-type multidrug transport system ATPase subunit
VRNITKYFGGLGAVRDLSFNVEKGNIFGLIGPNGAGKSTTLNTISAVLRSSSGSIEFDGERIDMLRRAGWYR